MFVYVCVVIKSLWFGVQHIEARVADSAGLTLITSKHANCNYTKAHLHRTTGSNKKLSKQYFLHNQFQLTPISPFKGQANDVSFLYVFAWTALQLM